MASGGAVNTNDAIVNGYEADVAITSIGSSFYFAVCGVMTFSTFVFLGLGFMKPRSQRIFHYITSGVTMVAAIAYFTMGSHLGFASITIEFQRTAADVMGTTREIYYARYIDWVITTPLLLLDLLLTAAMPKSTILFVILVDEVMIITGLIGALVASEYKWGFFTFGCVALLYIAYQLVWESRRHASAVSVEAGKTFLYCGSLTTVLWFLYPIAWGVSEGGNVIDSDNEAIFYGILDMLAKPVFGALLIWGHRNIDPASLGLSIKEYGPQDPVIQDKTRAPGNNGVSGSDGATNGTHEATPATV